MKMRYITYILIGVIITLGGVFTGCSDDDDLNSIDLVVFMRPGGLEAKKVLYTPIPNAVIEDYGDIDFPVQITRELEADATITLAIDDSMVDVYNEKNGTNYKPLPASYYTEVGGTQISLKKGETFGSFGFKVNEPYKLYEMSKDIDGFILPVKIVDVSSDDAGLRVSDNFNVAYLIVAFNSFRNIKDVTETLVGTVHDKTGWSASANSSWSGFVGNLAIDGDLNTSWASTMANSWLNIDMKDTKTINGIRIACKYIYYGYYYFYATGVTISTSDDNTNWTSQGNASLIINKKEDGVDSYVYFYGPIDCRYVRINVTETYQGFTGISEVDMIK
jgi:hypothetical protein